ncbi:response regulator [Agrobacterium tumefaciens]|jgi:two-component system phosphate regulon response regulator OmpR|uniref:response regulator n=1 Tax=Agrobacterium tumefaciens TaxID=358 RepID=UPI0015743E87|nr:response regulator [Agrobacterium tumefaciens]WCK68742.1 response regulator [Agrobacterium tumefaciens]
MASEEMARDHVLVVDDDQRIRNMLATFFEDQGFVVSTAGDGVQMWAQLGNRKIDIVLLDLNLPGGKDGLDLAREIRMQSDVPIMMLTDRDDVIDRIVGIEVGADDYIAKPFHLREVLARLKAILRRRRPVEPNALHADEKIFYFEDWSLDTVRRKFADRAGNVVELTTAEYDMLLAFVCHPGRVLTRDFLMDETRSRPLQAFDRTIDAQIARLRKKIERDSRHPQLIKSVRGVGYIFTATIDYEAGRDARRS